MASAWIIRRKLDTGARYRVLFRLGGRETKPIYYGTFDTMKAARTRRDLVAGMLAAGMTPPPLKGLLAPGEQPQVRTVREVGEAWRRSRIDVADGTTQTHRVNLNRLYRVLGDQDFDAVAASDIAGWLAGLGLKRETLRKTRSTAAMVFDFGAQGRR